MKHQFLAGMLWLAALGCQAQGSVSPAVVSPAGTPTSQPGPMAGRKLVWADEFDKAGLPDSTKWRYDVGGDGWGNNELEYYTARRSENARVEEGKLIIEARKEDYKGSKYTSARLLTKGIAEWKYGRIEAMATLPKGVGTWPAVWMLGRNISSAGWPRCGELDIMEHVGFDEGVVHGTIHCEAYNHRKGTQKGGQVTVKNVTGEPHLYAIEWSADQIDFLVDNQPYYSVQKSVLGKTEDQWPFDQPFFLILNVAVGGGWGGQKGVDEAIWPQRMVVDYVRVYQ